MLALKISIFWDSNDFYKLMPVLQVKLTNFRNLANSKIDLSSKEIFFVGENGQGKSNLLETIYFSAYGSSFRTHRENEIVKNGERDFSIKTIYKDERGSLQDILVALENGKKRIDKNGKHLKDRKDLIETMPCVLFCHDDMEFVTGEPEKRRFFIDQCLSMYDLFYIDTIRRYKKVLKNRNQALKDRLYNMLDVYDQQLAENGLEIIKKRKAAIFQFNQIFPSLYEKISGIEGVKIKYSPSWIKSDGMLPTVEEIVKVLFNNREKDKILGTTTSGPHRDGILFFKDGKLFVPQSSTGQRRLITLLLRISQAMYFKMLTGKNPILLMDDVMLELDPDKREKVTSMLPEYDQLFCTFLPGEPYERYKKENTKIYFIKGGNWNE